MSGLRTAANTAAAAAVVAGTTKTPLEPCCLPVYSALDGDSRRHWRSSRGNDQGHPVDRLNTSGIQDLLKS